MIGNGPGNPTAEYATGCSRLSGGNPIVREDIEINPPHFLDS